MVCEPAFDYGARAGDVVGAGAGRRPAATRSTPARMSPAFRLFSDMRMGIEGNRVHARHTMREGERASARSSWAHELALPRTGRGGARGASTARTRFWRTWLGEGDFPDHPLRPHLQRSALVLKGLTFMPTGALLAALTTSLPGDPGGLAQLGLPLLLDARRDVHALGAARARSRLGGGRLRRVHRRPRAQRGRLAADHVRDQGRARTSRSARSSISRGTRTRGPCASATRPTSSARTTSTAPCSTPSTCTPSARDHIPERVWPVLVDAGRMRGARLARARPGHLGGARRAPSLRLLEAHVLGCARPRRAAGRTARRAAAPARLAGRSRTRSSKTSSHRGVDRRGVFRQHYDSDALDASNLLDPTRALPARPTTSACAPP